MPGAETSTDAESLVPSGRNAAFATVAGRIQIEVLDYHPSVPLLRILRNSGVDIADDVISQGAEGIDVRRRTGPADGNP